MALKGKGMLVTFAEVDAADEQDFNEWYNREHLDERVNLPGFKRARRYEAVGRAEIKYFATYECSKVADLADPGYLKLLGNQTPWSQRVMKRFRKFHRMTLRIRCDATHGVGGAVTLLRLVPDPAKAREFARWLAEEALPAAIRMPGMLGGFAGENDLEVANAPARAQGVGFPQASDVEWVVLLEGADPKATAAAQKTVLTRQALAAFGVKAAPRVTTGRLQFGNQR